MKLVKHARIHALVDQANQYKLIWDCPRWISLWGEVITGRGNTNRSKRLFTIPYQLLSLRTPVLWPALLLALLNDPAYRTLTQTWLEIP